MNLIKLFKLAGGAGLSADEVGELLAAAGIACSFTAVPVTARAFDALASSAVVPHSSLVELRGTMASGEGIHALLVFTSKS